MAGRMNAAYVLDGSKNKRTHKHQHKSHKLNGVPVIGFADYVPFSPIQGGCGCGCGGACNDRHIRTIGKVNVIGDATLNTQANRLASLRTLIRNNIEGIATALLTDISNNATMVQNWWQALGGTMSDLTADIAIGVQQPPSSSTSIANLTLPKTPIHNPMSYISGRQFKMNGPMKTIGGTYTSANPFTGAGGYPTFDGTNYTINPTTKTTVAPTLAANPQWQYFAFNSNVPDGNTATHIALCAACANASPTEMQAIWDWWQGGAQGANMCTPGDIATLTSFEARMGQSCTTAGIGNALEAYFIGEGKAQGTPQVPTSPAPCPNNSTGCQLLSVAGGLLTGAAATQGIPPAATNAVTGLISGAVGCGGTSQTQPMNTPLPPPPPPLPGISPGAIIGFSLLGLAAIFGIGYAISD